MAAPTILYEDRETRLPEARQEGDQLWLTKNALTKSTGWELKPEGLCKGEICVPVPPARHDALASDNEVNLTEFARLIQQAFAHDQAHDVWYFGPPGWEWKTRLTSGKAPDFTLPDMQGQMHSFSEWHGRKRFLLFWATW